MSDSLPLLPEAEPQPAARAAAASSARGTFNRVSFVFIAPCSSKWSRLLPQSYTSNPVGFPGLARQVPGDDREGRLGERPDPAADPLPAQHSGGAPMRDAQAAGGRRGARDREARGAALADQAADVPALHARDSAQRDGSR